MRAGLCQLFLGRGHIDFISTATNPTSRPTFTLIATTSRVKFWLDPVGVARNLGFSAREVNTIQSIVQANQRDLLKVWNGYFGSGGR